MTLIIPIGRRCLTALILDQLALRTTAFPFDWVNSDPYNIAIALDDELKDFYTEQDVPLAYLNSATRPSFYELALIRNRYGMYLPHVLNGASPLRGQLVDSVVKMKRRRDRLLRTLQGEQPVTFFLYNEVISAFDLQPLHRVLTQKYPTLRYRIVVLTHNLHGIEKKVVEANTVQVIGYFPVTSATGEILKPIDSSTLNKIRHYLLS